MDLQPYLPVILFILVGVAVGVAPQVIGFVFGPNRPDADRLARRVTRLGRRHASEPVVRQTNPRGETMYWIGAAGPAKDGAEGTDFHATEHGHIAVTPLKIDLTDHEHLQDWSQKATRLTPAA